MDMYKSKWTRLQHDILRFLFVKVGIAFNERGIARALDVSPTAVSTALAGLEKEGLICITKSTTMNLLSIELNRDNNKAIEMKRVENLRFVYESGLSDFLFDEFPGCTIILFGSYSRGEDVFGEEETRSDIDIAVIGTKGKKAELARFEKMLERPININFYESWNAIHRHLRNNILNGILLKGGVGL